MVRPNCLFHLLEALVYRFAGQRRGEASTEPRKDGTFFGVGLCAISSFGLARALLLQLYASFGWLFASCCHDATSY